VSKTVDVTQYGAVGDGATDDSAAIGRAVAALASGDLLHFPDRARGYSIGDTVIALPADAALDGIVGLAQQTPPAGAGFRIAGDRRGIVSGSQGNVFDSGRTLYHYMISCYTGNLIFPRGSTDGLLVWERPTANSHWVACLPSVDPDLGPVHVLHDITQPNPREAYIDPCMVELADGSLHVVYQYLSPGMSALQMQSSTDGGHTWGHVETIAPPDSGHEYSDPFFLRLANPDRVILCWRDHDRYGRRDTVHRTAFSDDGLVSLSIPTVATPAGGAASAGRIIDDSRGSIYEAADGSLVLLYSRKVGVAPAEVWARRISRIGAPMADPVRLATVPRVSGDHIQIGVDPIVTRLRDGTFALYFTAMDMSVGPSSYYGELHLMLSDDGSPESFAHDRTIILAENVGGGYGRPWPVCLPGGDVALIMTAAPAGGRADIIVIRHYHACTR
jgi:hypothetical protein